jgi:hypothetical protein
LSYGAIKCWPGKSPCQPQVVKLNISARLVDDPALEPGFGFGLTGMDRFVKTGATECFVTRRQSIC